MINLNPRYSKPKPLQLCYTCRHAEDFDILNPLKMGFCTASKRICMHAKHFCKAYERLPGKSWI